MLGKSMNETFSFAKLALPILVRALLNNLPFFLVLVHGIPQLVHFTPWFPFFLAIVLIALVLVFVAFVLNSATLLTLQSLGGGFFLF